jgi:hypothetical protein
MSEKLQNVTGFCKFIVYVNFCIVYAKLMLTDYKNTIVFLKCIVLSYLFTDYFYAFM